MPRIVPDELLQYVMVERTGWTLEYIDNLDSKAFTVMSTLALAQCKLESQFKKQKSRTLF